MKEKLWIQRRESITYEPGKKNGCPIVNLVLVKFVGFLAACGPQYCCGIWFFLLEL